MKPELISLKAIGLQFDMYAFKSGLKPIEQFISSKFLESLESEVRPKILKIQPEISEILKFGVQGPKELPVASYSRV